MVGPLGQDSASGLGAGGAPVGAGCRERPPTTQAPIGSFGSTGQGHERDAARPVGLVGEGGDPAGDLGLEVLVGVVGFSLVEPLGLALLAQVLGGGGLLRGHRRDGGLDGLVGLHEVPGLLFQQGQDLIPVLADGGDQVRRDGGMAHQPNPPLDGADFDTQVGEAVEDVLGAHSSTSPLRSRSPRASMRPPIPLAGRSAGGPAGRMGG